MSAVKFKLTRGALREIRNSPEVIADLEARAGRIAAAAGEGVEVLPAEKGRNRARVAVITATFPAILAEAKDRTLTRALSAGGD
jgi:arginine/ornithine N-succinyltransferase beta subunit